MRQIDVHKLADEAKFNRFHGLLLFWCCAIIVFDGYDLAVIGVTLPAIMKDMGVSPTVAGFMASSAVIGMAFGAIVLGTAADRIGRRLTIAICLLVFSVFTAAAGLTHEPYSFSAARFIAGLGIGGVMPSVVAQMTEFSPRKVKAMMVTASFGGFSIGGMLASVVGKGLLESWGWPSVFFLGALPALLVPLVLKGIPESMAFLIKQGRTDELRQLVARIDPGRPLRSDDRFALPAEDRASGTPFRRLFDDGRALSTSMFWVATFACLFVIYGTSYWMVKLMTAAGYSVGTALSVILVLNVGALLGCIVGGWLADRFSIKWVLCVLYAVAAIAVYLLGTPLPVEALFLVAAIAGAALYGGQTVTYAYAGQFYPMAMRSTGVGWAAGVGRSGAILAPIVVGALVGAGLTVPQTFLALAIPAAIAAGVVAFIDHRCSASAHHEDVSAEVLA